MTGDDVINRPPCVFAPALLAHCAVCELARHRDADVACADPVAPAAHAADVHKLVRTANERHGSLDALPFAAIVQGVAAWPPRHDR